MSSLFSDPIIAKGNGFEIKQSELDEVLLAIKSTAAARGQSIPPGIKGQLLNRLIQIQPLFQLATDDDKAKGKMNADQQINNLLEKAGSQEGFELMLKTAGMTQDEFRSKITQEETSKAVLIRKLGITVTDDEAKQYYTDHQTEFVHPEAPSQNVDYATVADKIKNLVLQKKIGKLAPAYLDKLENDGGVEILDPDLKTSAAAPPPTATP